MDQLVYEVAMGLIPGIGPHLTRQLVSYCGSARDFFQAPSGKLLKVPGIGPNLVAAFRSKNAALREAEVLVARAEKEQVQLLFYTHPRYPARLKQVPDAPTLLFYQGSANLNHSKVISIVGTRQATPYGREVTEQLVEGLVKHQVLVVSGLAYGIDVTAHRAAIQANLPTVGVMANGIDIMYPSVHRKIRDKMLDNGGLLTEYTFGSLPEAPKFPARNRIIAGMADATIVVEAAAKGGALITADIAHSYNRDVLAVPGPINAPFSEGCNFLIKTNKAATFTRVKDLEEILNWDLETAGNGHSRRQTAYDPNDFSLPEFQLIQILAQGKDAQIDDLSWKSQLPIHQVASLLLGLEFKGVVKALPGKKYQLL